MNSSNTKQDDLTKIKGIGSVRQQWLRDSFGVLTYRELADLAPEDIESQLKKDNQIASRETIEAWIEEAQRLTAKSKPAPRESTDIDKSEEEDRFTETIKHTPAASELANSEAVNDDSANGPKPKEGDWKPFASFVTEFKERLINDQVVEYRTSVHHVEEDTSREWSGLERDKHWEWMLDQLGDSITKQQLSAETDTRLDEAKPIPVADKTVKVEIAQVRIYQPPNVEDPVVTGQAGQSLKGLLTGDKSFALEIKFSLVGETAVEFTSQTANYRIRAYAQNQLTDEETSLGEAAPGRLETDKLNYAVRLSSVALPPGKYRLFAFVNLQAASVLPDFVTFPEIIVR